MTSRRAGHHNDWTDESVWTEYFSNTRLPELSVLGPTGQPRRVLVTSAHPDDDILAIGGLLCALNESGAELTCAVATDGEASHHETHTPGGVLLGEARRSEYLSALHALGLSDTTVHFFGLPDSGLRDHELAVASQLRTLMPGHDTVLTPWVFDGHPDHEAVGRAASMAAEPGPEIWQYPVWMWHWARPTTQQISWPQACGIELTTNQRAKKSTAIAVFETQLQPFGGEPAILPKPVLEHFGRSHEVVFIQ